MNYLKINPKKLQGEVKIPPSKSMAHRAIICAGLSREESLITNLDYSEDILATISAMEKLGAQVERGVDYVRVRGGNLKALKGASIDCKESGSTLRFMIPLFLVEENEVCFVGKGNLGKRPLTSYYEIFQQQKIKYDSEEGVLNLKISGKLKAGKFNLPGNVSSQFISGLLFTLPLLEGDSVVNITTELESKGYIDLTLSMLKNFGVIIHNKNYEKFIIKGNQEYKGFNYEVEGDYSQAAFYLCASALGNEVVSKGLIEDSLQGDKEILSILEKMGCTITEGLYAKADRLKGTIIDASQCPDIIPVVTVVAALSEGTTKIINAGRLRIKECDRLKAITTELNKLGAKVFEGKDYIEVEGVSTFKGGVIVDSWEDHRIAMSLAIASTRCIEPIILKNPQCVKKSYPGFWKDFGGLGGEFHEWNMGQ